HNLGNNLDAAVLECCHSITSTRGLILDYKKDILSGGLQKDKHDKDDIKLILFESMLDQDILGYILYHLTDADTLSIKQQSPYTIEGGPGSTYPINSLLNNLRCTQDTEEDLNPRASTKEPVAKVILVDIQSLYFLRVINTIAAASFIILRGLQLDHTTILYAQALIGCQIWQFTSFFPDRFGQTMYYIYIHINLRMMKLHIFEDSSYFNIVLHDGLHELKWATRHECVDGWALASNMLMGFDLDLEGIHVFWIGEDGDPKLPLNNITFVLRKEEDFCIMLYFLGKNKCNLATRGGAQARYLNGRHKGNLEWTYYSHHHLEFLQYGGMQHIHFLGIFLLTDTIHLVAIVIFVRLGNEKS
ncbi:hypothetical protein ACJX0J_018767, partial [Zea mays]